MPVPPAIENRIQTTIMQELGKIGVVGSDWLTNPSAPIAEPPGETISALMTQPALFAHLSSTASDLDSAGNLHYWKSTFSIYCVSTTFVELLNLKADVLRCLYAAEGVFTQEYGQPLYAQSFDLRSDFADTGLYMGVLTTTIDYNTDHLTP